MPVAKKAIIPGPKPKLGQQFSKATSNNKGVASKKLS